MKRINAILAVTGLLLYLIHGLSSGFFMVGLLPFSPIYKSSGWFFIYIIWFHAALGVIFMFRNIFSRIKARNNLSLYPSVNARYLGQRITGVLLFIICFFHIGLFGSTDAQGQYHLRQFTTISLLIQIAMIVLAFCHLLFSLKPSLLSFNLDYESGIGKTIYRILICILIGASLWMIVANGFYRSFF